jgi:hypothetical protein
LSFKRPRLAIPIGSKRQVTTQEEYSKIDSKPPWKMRREKLKTSMWHSVFL